MNKMKKMGLKKVCCEAGRATQRAIRTETNRVRKFKNLIVGSRR